MSTNSNKWKIYPPLLENVDSKKMVDVLLKIRNSEPENGALVYVQAFGHVFEYNSRFDTWDNTFRSPQELLIVMARIDDMGEFNKKMSQFEGKRNGNKYEAVAV